VSPSETILELSGVTRRFPGVVALDDVDFDLRRGEVHALVGENGAGKSTLINVISGVLQPDDGQLHLHNENLVLSGPLAARQRGIVAVHQEGELFAPLSVAENMALSVGLPLGATGQVDWRRVRYTAQQAAAQLPEDISTRQPAGRLSIAHRYMTRLAAAFTQQASVVLLDEPTSALTGPEVDWLFAKIDELRARGVGIIYISHRQEEIFRLADRITILRDGRRVLSADAEDLDDDALIQAMVGRTPIDTEQPRTRGFDDSSQVRLDVSQLTDTNGRFRDVSFSVRAGEIVGMYGLVGAGRTEIAAAIYGLRSFTGRVTVDEQTLRARKPGEAITAGIAAVPEDRLHEGLCHGLSLETNLSLSSLDRWSTGAWVHRRSEKAATLETAKRLGVRYRDLEQPAAQLSGGNQQKLVLGRCLLSQPKVLLLDEPTRGVDVGAKGEIHRLLRDIAENDAAILLISSDLPELLDNTDRLLVVRSGRIAAEFETDQATPEDVARAALPTEAPDKPAPRRRFAWPSGWPRLPASEVGLFLAVALLCGWLALTNPRFLSPENLRGVLSGASIWVVLAMAAALVIIPGGIDISIGSLMALSAAAAGLMMQQGRGDPLGIALAVLVAFAVGAAGGALNATLSLWGRIHPIVVTLGTMTIFRGLLILLTGGDTISRLPAGFEALAGHTLLGIPGLAIFGAFAALAVHYYLHYRPGGRYLYAWGSSPQAARLVGITKRRVWLSAFSLAGCLVALAGLMELARAGSLQSGLGSGFELRAIAAAVIGGTAITGGRGSATGVVLGSLLLSLIQNALVLWQVSRYQYDVVIGSLLLVAIALDWLWRRNES